MAATGAVPLAVTNCLNFGSPEDPAVMWQFREAVRGLADGCLQLGTPVTGGNVSFYNSTGDVAIHPTPVVGVLGFSTTPIGALPCRGARTASSSTCWGTADEFGGSEWAHLQGHLGGVPPQIDLDAERVLAEILVAGSRDGMLTAAHDLSDGGVAIGLIEMALRSGIGARLWIPDDVDPFLFLLSESATRALVVVPRSEELRFTEMCGARHFPCQRIGVVDSGLRSDLERDDEVLVIGNVYGEDLIIGFDELRSAYEATLPALFGG